MDSVKKVLSGLLVIFTCLGAGPAGNCFGSLDISADQAKTLARNAYLYGFPLVMNYKTIYSYVIDEDSPEYKGPFNQIACEARLFTPDDKATVTPNADTPYCMFWIDLRSEPQVLSVPEMETERFYHFQLIDLYTHNFAYIGTLTTGNGASNVRLPPLWGCMETLQPKQPIPPIWSIVTGSRLMVRQTVIP